MYQEFAKPAVSGILSKNNKLVARYNWCERKSFSEQNVIHQHQCDRQARKMYFVYLLTHNTCTSSLLCCLVTKSIKHTVGIHTCIGAALPQYNTKLPTLCDIEQFLTIRFEYNNQQRRGNRDLLGASDPS